MNELKVNKIKINLTKRKNVFFPRKASLLLGEMIEINKKDVVCDLGT